MLVSLWWVAALAVEGGYGLNILKYTETVQTVAATSLASEVLRGLGYWYFYDGDELGQWVSTSVQFTQQLWLIALSFAVPLVAFLGAVIVRWRARAYFVFLVLIGMVAAVGAHPYVNGTVVVQGHQDLHDPDRGRPGPAVDRPGHPDGDPRSGHAARGRGHGPLPEEPKLAGLLVGLLVLGLVVAADPPVFNGTTVADHFTQPSTLPPLRDRDGQGPERRAPEHPGAGHPGGELRRLPLRGRHRPGLARGSSPGPSSPGSSRPSARWPPTTCSTGSTTPCRTGSSNRTPSPRWPG